MSLLFTGSKTRSRGILDAVKRLSKLVNLKPAKAITVKFDPFHESAAALRQFSHRVSYKDIILTNPTCRIRTEVISSQKEHPCIEVKLNNGESLLIKCHSLDVAEMFQLIIKHVSSLVPPPVPAANSAAVPKVAKRK